MRAMLLGSLFASCSGPTDDFVDDCTPQRYYLDVDHDMDADGRKDIVIGAPSDGGGGGVWVLLP